MLLQRIIYGTILIVIGVTTLKFNYQIVGITGRQDWIEDRLGSGSTYFIFKLFSIILITIALAYITGYAAPIARWLFSPLARVFNTQP